MDASVVVVGGGATGTSVARDLAMRGCSVTLLERGALTGGTSGRSHGVLHSGARYLPEDPDDARHCLAENRTLREIAPGCVEPTGGYFCSLSGDDPAYLREQRRACGSVGMDVELLDGATVREDVSALSPDVERALAVPDAVISPARLVAATAADARDHGATIECGVAATDVHVDEDGGDGDWDEGGRVTGVTAVTVDGAETDRRRIDADHVVNATGAWAGEVAALAGVDVPMAPSRGVMVVTEQPSAPVQSVLNRCRPPADGDIVVPRGDHVVLGTTSVPVSGPDDVPTTVEQTARTDDQDGHTVPESPASSPPTREGEGDVDTHGPAAEIGRVRRECGVMVPELADRPVQRVYWGVRPLYADEDTDGSAADRGGRRAISRDFAVLEHATRDDLDGLTTVVGGKLTTSRLMAEAVADRVCDALGVEAACRTATRRLPAQDDTDRLDALVEAFGGPGPADAGLL